MAGRDLIPLYRELAAQGEALRGLSVLRYADDIAALVRKHQAKRLLDYGCGAGDAYRQPHLVHRRWGLKWFDVRLYDPAFPDHQEAPRGLYDGVICSDVLEHVPEEAVDELVATLFRHARSFVWASVCCRPARKTFADGTNLHCTLQPIDWWRAAFDRHAGGKPYTLVESP